MSISNSTIMTPPSDVKIVRTLPRSEFMPKESCKICGSNHWSLITRLQNTTRPSISFPCTWTDKDGKKSFAHLVEVLIAEIFKYTIEEKPVRFVASHSSHEVQRKPGKFDKDFVRSIMKTLSESHFGCSLNIKEKLKALRDQAKTNNNFTVLQTFTGQDIHEAFAWMRDEPHLEQDMDDEKESIDSSLRLHSEVYSHINPTPPNEDLEQMYSDDSDDDAHVDWDDV